MVLRMGSALVAARLADTAKAERPLSQIVWKTIIFHILKLSSVSPLFSGAESGFRPLV